jgi:drug/metabolite transporter (DMT)-like permease
MKPETPRVHPYFALVVGVLAISMAAVLVKLASAPASVVAAYRLLCTVLIMTPVMLIYYRQELKLIGTREWKYTLLSGLFLALHFILWFESLNYTSVASSVVLVTLQPLFTFVGGYIFYQERLGAKAIFGGALAVAGSFIIFWGDFRIGGVALFGNMLALLGAVMVSGYWLVGQNVRKRLSLMTYTYVVYGSSSLFLLIYVLTLQYPLYPYPMEDWIIFISLAIFPTLLGHSVFNWALKWLSASVISMSILFEPIGAAILAYFILGETLQLSQWLGGSVILLGIYLFIRQYEKTPRESLKKKGAAQDD